MKANLTRLMKLASKPVRTCQSLHHCEACGKDIVLGEQYFDGGSSSRRVHFRCLQRVAKDLERVCRSLDDMRAGARL